MKGNSFVQQQAYSLLARQIFLSGFPKHLYIEPTNNCQLSCSICPRKDSRKRTGFIDVELFKNIIDESLRFGQREKIMLYKDGEPLLHPSLSLMIELAKKSKAAKTISISTNALGLNREKAKELLQTGLGEIIISFDGVCRETYESIRVGSDYEQVIKNLYTFLSLKKSYRKKSPRVVMQIVDIDKTRKEIISFQKKWVNLVDEVKVKEFRTWTGHIHLSGHTQKEERNPCFSLWTTLAINWDGDVSICSMDFNKQGILGNVNDSSLYELWHGRRLRELRMRHLQGDFENLFPCGPCCDWQSHPEFWSNKNIERAKEFIEIP